MAPGIFGMETAAANAAAISGTPPANAVLAFLSVLDTCLEPDLEAQKDEQDAPPAAAETAAMLPFSPVPFTPVPLCVAPPCAPAAGVRNEEGVVPASEVPAPAEPPAEFQIAPEPPPGHPAAAEPQAAVPVSEAAPEPTVTASLRRANTEPQPQEQAKLPAPPYGSSVCTLVGQAVSPARRPYEQDSEPEREQRFEEPLTAPPAASIAPPAEVVFTPLPAPETFHPAHGLEAAPAAASPTPPATPDTSGDQTVEGVFRGQEVIADAPTAPVAFELRLAPSRPAAEQASVPISGIPAAPIKPNIERPAARPAPAGGPASRLEASSATTPDTTQTAPVRAAAAARWAGPATEEEPHPGSVPQTAVPAPAPEVPPEDAAPPAEAQPAPRAAEPSEPRHPAAPVRALTLTVEGQQQKIDIRMSERRGGIHVSVHAPESNLRRQLQDQLPELIHGLQRQGFAAESWQPAASRSDARESGAQDAPHGGQSGGQGGAAQDGRGRRRPPSPAWLEEIRRSAQGEAQSERSASLWQ